MSFHKAMKKIFAELFKISIVLIFPFILLIRGAVTFHEQFQLAPMLAILAGVLAAAFLLFLYFSIVYGQFTGRLGSGTAVRRRAFWALAITVLFAIHGIFYMSSENMKNPEVRQEINKVHPILRLSVSTLVYIDKDLIITDAKRQPEDYSKMGLTQVPKNGDVVATNRC